MSRIAESASVAQQEVQIEEIRIGRTRDDEVAGRRQKRVGVVVVERAPRRPPGALAALHRLAAGAAAPRIAPPLRAIRARPPPADAPVRATVPPPPHPAPPPAVAATPPR